MIGSTSDPWAWTQSSRSTPTSSMPNLSFTCRFRRSCRAENLSGKNTRMVWLVKTFGFTRFREGICSTHKGFLVTYTTSFKIKYTSSREEHGWPSRGYNLPKALCIRGRTHKVIEYEGHCRITIQQWIGWSTMELMWVSVLHQRKKECTSIIL